MGYLFYKKNSFGTIFIYQNLFWDKFFISSLVFKHFLRKLVLVYFFEQKHYDLHKLQHNFGTKF